MPSIVRKESTMIFLIKILFVDEGNLGKKDEGSEV
jgi:hypothetical protein